MVGKAVRFRDVDYEQVKSVCWEVFGKKVRSYLHDGKKPVLYIYFPSTEDSDSEGQKRQRRFNAKFCKPDGTLATIREVRDLGFGMDTLLESTDLHLVQACESEMQDILLSLNLPFDVCMNQIRGGGPVKRKPGHGQWYCVHLSVRENGWRPWVVNTQNLQKRLVNDTWNIAKVLNDCPKKIPSLHLQLYR